MAKIQKHRRDVAEGIAESVSRFVHALHQAGGAGRYPEKIRQSMQVIAIAVSKAVVLSRCKTTIKEVAEALGLDPKLISACRKRFDALTDGEWEEIFALRGAMRSDIMDSEWVEFALAFWTDPDLANENDEAYNFTRRAESASKVVRNPKDRSKESQPHRIHWLEERVGLIYETMLKRGKQVFGEGFHMSWTFFLDLRPFYVKDATRETCLCIYHLRFEEMASSLISYRNTLKQHKIITCYCNMPANSSALRKQLVCPRLGSDSQTVDNLDCMLQKCEECKDLKRLFSSPCSICTDKTRYLGDENLALKIKYESYEKVKYVTKDGTEKVRSLVTCLLRDGIVM